MSIEDRRQRLDAIERLMVAGVGMNKIEDAIAEKFGMTRGKVKAYVAEIRKRWAEEERANRPTYKAQGMRRIYGHIAEARKDKNWNAVAQLEKLLSEMQGTKEPVEIQLNVDSTVTEAALFVVANLTPEKRAAILAEQRALRALREKTSIDTVGETVGETTPVSPESGQ